MSDQHQLSQESMMLLTPAELYEKLPTQRLLTGFYLENRFFEMQVYLMLLHRSGLPLPTSLQDWQLKARKLQLTDLEPIYRICRDDVLVQLIFYLKIQWHLMLKELAKRFNDKPVGMAFLMENLQDLERLWIQPRRLKIDAEDVKQDGWNKGIELVNNAQQRSLGAEDHKTFLNLPPPNFPIEMDQFESTAWHWLMDDAWVPSLRATFGNVVPLLNGDIEVTGTKVDNFLREQPRTARRHKDIFQGKENFPKKGQDSWRADWDFSEAAAEGRRHDFEEAFHPQDKSNRTLDVSSRLLDALRVAKKRWGEKAVIALKYCAEDKTQEEAAELAGIGVSTLKGYIFKLNKEFSKKK